MQNRTQNLTTQQQPLYMLASNPHEQGRLANFIVAFNKRPVERRAHVYAMLYRRLQGANNVWLDLTDLGIFSEQVQRVMSLGVAASQIRADASPRDQLIYALPIIIGVRQIPLTLVDLLLLSYQPQPIVTSVKNRAFLTAFGSTMARARTGKYSQPQLAALLTTWKNATRATIDWMERGKYAQVPIATILELCNLLGIHLLPLLSQY